MKGMNPNQPQAEGEEASPFGGLSSVGGSMGSGLSSLGGGFSSMSGGLSSMGGSLGGGITASMTALKVLDADNKMKMNPLQMRKAGVIIQNMQGAEFSNEQINDVCRALVSY